MLALVLAAVVAQVGPPGKGAPPAWETAKLFFLAGDLPRAQEWARRCVKSHPKICRPLNKNIAEYAFLAPRLDELTADQARQFFSIDRAISPGVPGKLTEKALERYVRRPLVIAAARLDQGDANGAQQLADQVRAVNATAAELVAFDARLQGNRADAGP